MSYKKITLAITGASGMPYAICLLKELLRQNCQVNLIISKAGIITIHQELGVALAANPEQIKAKFTTNFMLANSERLHVYGIEDWYAPTASGTSVDDIMIVCPCTMATLGKIANGIGDDLIARSADVILKERRDLILVPREMPFSAIHLENMLKLAKLGAAIVPPIPGFYTHPKTIDDMVDFVVSRILDQIDLANSLVKRW